MSAPASRPRLVALELAEDPRAWAALGFTVTADGRCRIGATELRLRGGDGGITGWALSGVRATALDGLPTALEDPPDAAAPAEHPNGVTAIDHVVVSTPDADRTFAALEAAGLELRGTRDAGSGRQGFLLLEDALVEVVGPQEPDGLQPAEFWGLTLVTADLDAAAALLGERCGRVKEAVQPGRRIATVRGSDAGVRVPLALMTPRPGAG